MDSIAGVPTHPLVVHLPVVLIPVTLLAAIVSVAWRRARRAAAAVALGSALVAAAGAQLATITGEELEERVDVTAAVREHAALGESTRTLAFLTAVAALLWFARAAGARRLPGAGRVRRLLAPRAVGAALAAALVATALLTTVWDVRTGHEGASAAWSAEGPSLSAPASAASR
ncbi:DUF2231 domain-containing protein [Miltoncostaea marina]|uniref:DUF2231 domain-containing protein n=1 Tax=Miltoncostaea marina TaxID=2843215 RepID=UPI001C3E757C|nr:DUF2231 domain-containing protein [Miltoncostaea marina]